MFVALLNYFFIGGDLGSVFEKVSIRKGNSCSFYEGYLMSGIDYSKSMAGIGAIFLMLSSVPAVGVFLGFLV